MKKKTAAPIKALIVVALFLLNASLSPRDLALVDDAGKRVLEPGEFRITLGGKQPGFKGNADARTTGALSASFVVTGKSVEVP